MLLNQGVAKCSVVCVVLYEKIGENIQSKLGMLILINPYFVEVSMRKCTSVSLDGLEILSHQLFISTLDV